jgi:two-component system response regulator RegX3
VTDSVPENARVLVVADNDQDREELATVLGSEGYIVMAVATVPDGLQRLKEAGADIVLLDIASPKNTCFAMCRQIQEVADVPIILISAEHDELVVASTLEQCASDYITKPVRARELIARLRAVLRRTQTDLTGTSVERCDNESPQGSAIVLGRIEIQPASRRLLIDGEPVELSRRDFDLLVFLASPPGRLRTREELIDRIWSDKELADTRTLDKHVARLRTRIEPSPKNPRHLKTVHGVGFRLDNP